MMKILILYVTLIVLISCIFCDESVRKEVDDGNDYFPEKAAKKIARLIQNGEQTMKKNGTISAEINEYIDEVLVHVNKYFISHGYDPLELPEEKFDISESLLIITHGSLTELSKLSRNGDALVSYNYDNRKVLISVPLGFTTLLSSHGYYIELNSIDIRGFIDVKLANIKVNMDLAFNFNTYQAFLDRIEITDKGDASFHFTGTDLIDSKIAEISGAVRSLLHPIILGVAQLSVSVQAQKIIDVINDVLNGVLHPSSTTTTLPSQIITPIEV